MNKTQFIQYSAKRYGIDESIAETFVDMFSDCLAELLHAGQSVEIDEIGTFNTTSLFPQGLKHPNNHTLAKLAKSNMVSFEASKLLTNDIA